MVIPLIAIGIMSAIPFLLPSDIATIIVSKNFKAFLITSICPYVIGSNVPG